MFSKPKPVSRKDAKVAKKSDAFVFKDPSGSRVCRLMTAAFVLLCLAGVSSAADIKIVPSVAKVTPGESFYADVVVEGIPSEGLGAVQFRLNVSAPGSTVAAVPDTSLGQPADVSVSSPLTIGPATTSRSGISDFFWNAKGSHGILVMDNEALQSGSGLYTLGHTNGALLPSGSGSVARFQINAGKEAAAEKIVISLSDVALLDGSTVYPLDTNTAATVDLKCYTQVPNLIGMSKTDAETALTNAKLSLGTIYEIDNSAGAHALNTVLVQSANAGTTILCETAIDLAINTPPSEATNVHALDKTGDESGTVVLSWLPSPSSDAAGYRVYNAAGVRIAELANASSTGVEVSGLTSGAASQLRITAYDTYGNESAGVSISATALDDVAPRISISGVSDGSYYASDVQPVITVQDANLATKEFMLNGILYNQVAVTLEGNYLLTASATDTAGNSSFKEMRFTVDKTPPDTAISASDQLIDGVINTVSPSTFFTLTSVDALSGVKSITYRIDDGIWQTYTGSFNLAGMNAGQHIIGYKATDNILNGEGEKTLTIRLIIIQVEKKIAADSVVLVGFESDKSDFDQKQADIQKLSSLLASLNLMYTVAQNMDEFTTAMRSGRYNTYVMVDVKEPLVNEEVREAVHNGDALIFIKTRPNADPFLDDVFGVKFSGKTTSDNLIVDLLSNPISSEGALQTTGKSVISTITSERAQVFGSAVDKHNTYPSIIFNQYELGKVLLYNFDLLNAADQSLASALLIESLNFVRPTAETPRARDSIPIRITLKNSTEPVDVKVTETVPSGTTVDTIVPRATPVDNTLTWQKSLAADASARFGYYLNLPDLSGDYLTKTELAYSNNGFFRPYGQYVLMLTVENNSDDLLPKIIGELRNLQVQSAADADLIAKAVDLLLLVTSDAANRKVAEENIRYVVQAIDEVRKLSIDVSAIRIELDGLLGVWEKKWYMMEI